MRGEDTGDFGAEGGATMAHEFGHNHGFIHVDCPPGQVELPVNDDFPLPPCQIGKLDESGEVGFEVEGQQPIGPGEAADMMSYFNRRWISGFTYSCLLGLLQTRGVFPPPLEPPAAWCGAVGGGRPCTWRPGTRRAR